MNSLSELVERLKSVEADRLVDTLRRMHNQGVKPDWDTLEASLTAPEPASPRQHALVEGPSVRTSGTRDAEAPQADAREFFVDLEQKLRKQQTTADAVIGRLRARERRVQPLPGENPPAQQLVSILALAESRAGGRFVVAHPGSSPVRVELRVGELTTGDGRPVGASVTLDPSAFELGPRTRRIVKVTFDLAGCDLRDRDRLTGRIQAFGTTGRCLLSVTVEIEVHDGNGA